MTYDFYEMALRMLVALLAGALIGYERSYRGRPAGFRTHALVCMASAMLMLVTVYDHHWVRTVVEVRLDPTRMAQGIMTGIGFLGAGVIMQEGLSVRGLTAIYRGRRGVVRAVEDVSFSVERGEIFGIVGESGSGKSSAVRAILRLLPAPPAEITGGEVSFEGVDLLKLSEAELCRIRGAKIGMVFQDPLQALNPVLPIGEQIASDRPPNVSQPDETKLRHTPRTPTAARRSAAGPKGPSAAAAGSISSRW